MVTGCVTLTQDYLCPDPPSWRIQPGRGVSLSGDAEMPYLVCEECHTRFRAFPCRSGARFCGRACYYKDRRRMADRGLRDRFWSKVKTGGPDECWPWLAGKLGRGYGCFYMRPGWRPAASRACWIIEKGDIPDGYHVCHTCDNPVCVNPSHLFLGTPTDNMQDCIRKGRFKASGSPQLKGIDHPRAIFNADQIREIRRRYAEGGISQQSLADEYGTDQCKISKVVRRFAYANVE